MAADPLGQTYEMEYLHQIKLNFIQIGQKCTPLDRDKQAQICAEGCEEEYFTLIFLI